MTTSFPVPERSYEFFRERMLQEAVKEIGRSRPHTPMSHQDVLCGDSDL
jgi:hypothetical protein